MSEYVNALDMEFAAEGFVDSIREKTSKIVEVIHKMLAACVKFLTDLISKLRRTKTATNDDPTPTSQRGTKSEVMVKTKGNGEEIVSVDVYNCGNELKGILEDVTFCIDLISKRPTPNHKTNRSYAERWAKDDELILERMANCMTIIEKLESIEYLTIDLETAEKFKVMFEELDKKYTKYGNAYDMYCKKNPAANSFMITTQQAFNSISTVASKAAKINLSLLTPKVD